MKAARQAIDGMVRPRLEAILIGTGLFVLLAAFVAADPPRGATGSVSPFTDEAFNLFGARNFAQLGRLSTDDWNTYLVSLPFTLIEALWFKLVGVGIVQGRLVAIACTALAAALLVGGLRGAIGRVPALFGGLAFASSGLVLVYGRLAFLEDMVVLGLVAGTVVLARDDRLTFRGGLASGVCYALAIGVKPSAAFAVAGILLAVALFLARDRAVRRWIAGSVVAIAALGLGWALLVWLPNRDAVALDLKIWAPEKISLSPIDAINSAIRYVRLSNDHLYGTMLGALLGLGSAGLVAIALLRKRLSKAQLRLVAASLGWLVFGFGILMIASYRPNRYVLPLVPALAILAAIGLCLTTQWLRERADGLEASARDADDDRAAGQPRPRSVTARRWLAPGLAAVATVVAVAPGLVWYGSWVRRATYDLPGIQARFANALPAGERVAGRDSALYLMRSGSVTLITQPGGGPANPGDLYATGVRWYLLPVDDPAPPGVSNAVWAARGTVMCAAYGGITNCLFHVP
jgi:4-amino-4-deoxy-L-arabinose transferase-like glycosyltransferase